ncbi:MAG: 50S ribosomal protein L23 [Bacteroidales bacterium]|jgi:large subunit ribosomal protein L23|nr:50S ribosomal protein L23 [Bacteroidales bacterium]MDD4214510.1 50S ribosomal protein L23 [Bacteroidales bacterium]
MNVIIKPIITEKMTGMSEKLNRYAFIIDTKANKLQVKKAVEELYDVKVDSVNTMNYLGKSKSRYTKAGYISGRKNSTKKAIVTLAEGEKIDFYSNI